MNWSTRLLLLPVLRLLLVRGEHVVLVVGELAIAVGRLVVGGLLDGRLARTVAPVAPRLAPGALELGDDRRQRPGERVDLVLVEQRAVLQLRLVLVEQALEAEQQRIVAPPFERRHLAVGVELRERVIDGHTPRRARRQVGDRLALEQDRLSGELPHPVEVGLAQFAYRSRGNVSGISHGKGWPRARVLIGVEKASEVSSEEAGAVPNPLRPDRQPPVVQEQRDLYLITPHWPAKRLEQDFSTKHRRCRGRDRAGGRRGDRHRPGQ
jgi:hypothetical protein